MKILKNWKTNISLYAPSVQFSSVSQFCLTLCNPMNCSTPGLPVYHQLLEFTQSHVLRVRDAMQPSHPLSSPSPPAPNPSQHLGRKIMTNLDNILKSRDITLPTKVCLVKAMVFPVAMYWCESWTIKKAAHWRIHAFELWYWKRLLKFNIHLW